MTPPFDPFAEAVFPDDLLQPFAELRASGQVPFSPALGGWVVTRYADVRACLTDPRLTADRTPSFLASLAAIGHYADDGPLADVRHQMVLFTDGAHHEHLRAALSPISGLHRSATMASTTVVCSSLLDSLCRLDEIDGVEDFAAPLALWHLTSALGVASGEGRVIKLWTDCFNRAIAVPLSRNSVDVGQDAVDEFGEWLATVEAQSGLIRHLRELVADGHLTVPAMRGSVLSVVSAGHNTVTDLITNTLATIATFSPLRNALTTDPELIERAVEEALRLVGPVQVTRREALESLAIGSTRIDAGDRVVLAIASANRDGMVFNNPDLFEPKRDDLYRTIAFGFGSHRCVGTVLGRVQATVAVREFLSRFPRFQSVGPALWRPGLTMRGRQHLRVVLDP